MKKLNVANKVKVDIVCRFPIAIGRTTLAGVYKNVMFSVADLRMLIAGKAKVDRILSNGKRVRVGFDDYDNDFDAEIVDRRAEQQKIIEQRIAEANAKKAAESKKEAVSTPVKKVEEKKEEVKAGEAPKAEEVKKDNKPQQPQQSNKNKK